MELFDRAIPDEADARALRDSYTGRDKATCLLSGRALWGDAHDGM